jgi:L-seryl-tRNA(Ser) seleniumtransferase
MLTRPVGELQATAERVLGPLRRALDRAFEVAIVECMSQIGSGALPLEEIPSRGLNIAAREKRTAGRLLDALAQELRALPIPVIGRMAGGALILDLRTLDDEAAFVEQLSKMEGALGSRSQP